MLGRILGRAACGGLLVLAGAAMLLIGGALLAPHQFVDDLRAVGLDVDAVGSWMAKTVASTRASVPTVPPDSESALTAGDKAINKVGLSVPDGSAGFVSVVPFGGKTSAEWPYAFSLSFQWLTIASVDKSQETGGNGLPKYIWVAVTAPGSRVQRESTGRAVTNFDGTKTEQYLYRGLTAWMLVTDEIIVWTRGSSIGHQGIGSIVESLEVGRTISFNSSINQNDPRYQQMNLESFERLSNAVGKDATDRSDRSFVFFANFATVDRE